MEVLTSSDGGGFPINNERRLGLRNASYIYFFLYPDSLDDATVAAPIGGCNIANRRRLRVLAQCKAEKRKMGPGYLRELEGVVYRYANTSAHPPRITQAILPPTSIDDPNPNPNIPSIALLISESAFTRHCLLAAHASPLPFLLVHLPPSPLPLSSSSSRSTSSGAGASSGSGSSSAIGTMFGNPALVSAKGLLGGELEIRWEHGGGIGSGVPLSQSRSQSKLSGMLGDTDAGRPKLWWRGQPLPNWTPETGADVDGDGVVL